MGAVDGVAVRWSEVENGFNRMPGGCDRYEGRRYVTSNMPERMTLDALVAIFYLLMVVCCRKISSRQGGRKIVVEIYFKPQHHKIAHTGKLNSFWKHDLVLHSKVYVVHALIIRRTANYVFFKHPSSPSSCHSAASSSIV